MTIENIPIGHTLGTEISAVARAINENFDKLQLKAYYKVASTSAPVLGGDVKGLIIRGAYIGDIEGV